MALKPEIEEKTIADLHNFLMTFSYATKPLEDGSARTLDLVALRLIELCKNDDEKIIDLLDDLESTLEMVEIFTGVVIEQADNLRQLKNSEGETH